jgi:glycosyltransferase involved in cell wall biosynthesis
MTDTLRILLIAPNISKHMGGEALKALHIMTGLQQLGMHVTQLTHARVRGELAEMQLPVTLEYIEDDWLQTTAYRFRMDWLLAAWGSWLLHRKARQLARSNRYDIIHFTAPISPTLPYFRLDGAPVVIGPLNGNLLHPPMLMHREVRHKKLGAAMLWPYQKTIGKIFRGKHHATLLVSGGERTKDALKLAGCSDTQIIEALDSGVEESMANRPRLQHHGINHDFIFVGRLIRYKACDLVIRAVAQTASARLHIVGDGDERAALELLAKTLGVADRVIFHGWVPAGEPLMALFGKARAFMFPTLAEANGIVVQEAMMIGLPIVAVNWGGPQQLLDDNSGILIEPISEDHIVQQLATAMTRLAEHPEQAEQLSINARKKAEAAGFAWPILLQNWLELYRSILRDKNR